MRVTLARYRAAHAARAWAWLAEYPDANLDDYGPRTAAEFAREMDRRLEAGEIARLALYDGRPVGLMGYCPVTERTGMMHGICFAREVHGTGVARRAVHAFLCELFAAGVEKVAAAYFADNERVRRLLAKLGAREEGYLRRQTLRGGEAVDMRLVAIFREELCLLGGC